MPDFPAPTDALASDAESTDAEGGSPPPRPPPPAAAAAAEDSTSVSAQRRALKAESSNKKEASVKDTMKGLQKKVETLHKEMRETSLDRLFSAQTEPMGLREMLHLSNQLIMQIQERVNDELSDKVPDAGTGVRAQMLELLVDNAALRLRLNDYYWGLNRPAMYKDEQMQQQFQEEKAQFDREKAGQAPPSKTLGMFGWTDMAQAGQDEA